MLMIKNKSLSVFMIIIQPHCKVRLYDTDKVRPAQIRNGLKSALKCHLSPTKGRENKGR